MLLIKYKTFGHRQISIPYTTFGALITIGLLVSNIMLTFGFQYESNNSLDRLQEIAETKKCYNFRSQTEQKIYFLEDVLKSIKKPEPNKSIFFLVTSCSKNGSVEMNGRQACAIESAAKWNPNRDIFVLFALPVGFVYNEAISPIIQSLGSYPNIYFQTLNLSSYSENTPAEHWHKIDEIFSSNYLVPHMLDYLRLLTLYKFGGIYFDLDFVILKNLDDLSENFAGAESRTSVNNAALGFNFGDTGHKILEMIVRENTENYRPNEWAFNGSGCVTRVLNEICGKNNTDDMKPENCWGFQIYPRDIFYAIPEHNWQNFFDKDPKIVSETLAAVKDSFAVHMWNYVSKTQQILKSEPTTAYGILAGKNCPKVFRASGLYF